MFLRRSHFFTIIEKKTNKSLYKYVNSNLTTGFDLRVRFQIYGQVTNRVGNIAEFGHK